MYVSSNVFVFSRFARPHSVPSPRGLGERSIFEERFENGFKRLVVVGKENFSEFINASKEETLIDNIISRFQRGDTSVLERASSFYADVTSMPSNLAEAQNKLIKLETNFNSLPLSVREKFDFSFDKYVNQVSNFTVDEFLTHFNLLESDSSKTDSNISEGGDSNDA